MIRTFDVEIERCVDVDSLRWPEPGEAVDDYGLGGNREYVDLRGLTWREVSETMAAEEELLSRYESSEGFSEDTAEDDEDAEEDFSLLRIIDVGLAGTVAALSAARCIPCTSCNAGAFGGRHHEDYPVVVFYARPQHLLLLLSAAEASGVGIVNSLGGGIAIYSDDVRLMPAFAKELFARRKDFRQLRFRAKERASPIYQAAHGNMALPFDDSAGA